jgi:predicted nucleic-acid-binding protein
LLNDIPAQNARAKALLSRSPTYVSDVVVAEAVFVMESFFRLDRPSVSHLIKMLMVVPGLISSFFLPDVIDLYLVRPALSWVDCYAAIEAKISGNNLYTFDKKLRIQGGQHVVIP